MTARPPSPISTGALEAVVTVSMVATIPRPLVICDLALPRDVDPAVRGLPGVTLIDLETLANSVRGCRACLRKSVRSSPTPWHRVVNKLLHAPTVRVKQLAGGPAGGAYAEALRALFALDPQAPAELATPRTNR